MVLETPEPDFSAAVIANSVIFAALHLLNPGVAPLAIVNLILFGIFASCYFIRRGNIWGIGALHSVWNLTAVLCERKEDGRYGGVAQMLQRDFR